MIQEEYKHILQAAMKVRQRTLRPEIRLLNELLQPALSPSERSAVSSHHSCLSLQHISRECTHKLRHEPFLQAADEKLV